MTRGMRARQWVAGGVIILAAALAQAATTPAHSTITFWTGAVSVDEAGNTSGLSGFGWPDPAFVVTEQDGAPVPPFQAWITDTFVNLQQWGNFAVIPDTRAIGPTPNSGKWGPTPPHWGGFAVQYEFRIAETERPAELFLEISVDDFVDVYLNGNLVASVTTNANGGNAWWAPWATVSVTDSTLFRTGVNDLWFVVDNAGDENSPTALDLRGYVDCELRVCVDTRNSGREDGTERRPFNTLQEALAAVPDGGIVKLAQGTYSGSLIIPSKPLIIQGGYVGGTYPPGGNFEELSRNPDPYTNETVIDGGGSPVTIQGLGGDGLLLSSLRVRGASLSRAVQLRRVMLTSAL